MGELFCCFKVFAAFFGILHINNTKNFLNKMHKGLIKYTQLLFVLLWLGGMPLSAQDYLPEKPKKETSVYDMANMMTGSEAKRLEQKLINYSDTTSTQIVVITINSLDGNEIALYATELAHKWGVGQKGKDNGVVVLVSKEDRRMTIRTGYGVEHLLTDALSRRIIENIMTPAFKQGKYYQGLDEGTSAIIQILSGEYKGEPKGQEPSGRIPALFIVIIFIVIFLILSRRNKRGGGRSGGRRSGGFSLLDAIILSSAGRGGFGGRGFGGGSSGGGFGGGGFGGGFGGGGFGGGGASGGW
jgi:uncharacterized protein